MLNYLIFKFLNDLAGLNPVLDWIFIFFAKWLGYVLIILLGFFLLFHKDVAEPSGFRPFMELKRKAKEFVLYIGTGVSAWLVSYILKTIIALPRPYLVFPEINLLFQHGSGLDSFPSGHATFYSALAFAVIFGSRTSKNHKKFGIFMALCALLIGISRIIAGVHFPLDIISGWAIGFIVAYVANKILRNKKAVN